VPQPGEELLFGWRLHWGSAMPVGAALARVVATRSGIGGILGQPRKRFSWRFVVDFAGGLLAMLGRATAVEAVISASRGVVQIPSARPLDAIGGYRAMFDLRPETDSVAPIELRLTLCADGQALSETWLYQWTPPAPPERSAALVGAG
jgi:glucans biosynthesis protein